MKRGGVKLTAFEALSTLPRTKYFSKYPAVVSDFRAYRVYSWQRGSVRFKLVIDKYGQVKSLTTSGPGEDLTDALKEMLEYVERDGA